MNAVRQAQLLVGLLVAVVVAIGVPMRATTLAQTTADEPHYLLTALSLAEDHDLDVSDERAVVRYRPFHDAALPAQAELQPDGRQIEPHDPLLPALLALPMWAGGWVGAKLALAVMAGLLAAMTLRLAVRRFGVGLRIAAVGAAIAGCSPPLAIYGTQVYPELAAALATVVGVGCLTGDLRRSRLIGALVAIAALPWLSVKYAPVALVLAVALAVVLYRRRRVGELVAAGAALALLGVTYLVAHHAWYGGWTVYAAGSHFVGGELTVMGDPDYVGRSIRLLGLLIDRNFGLIPWQPAYLLAIPAVVALVRRRPPGAALLLTAVAAAWLNATFVALTMHGWWWPGRQVVIVVPLVVVAMLWWIDRASLATQRLAAALGACGVVAYAALVFGTTTGRHTLIVDFNRVRDPLVWLARFVLPDLRRMAGIDVALFVLWLALTAVLALWGWRSAADRSGGDGPRAQATPSEAVSSRWSATTTSASASADVSS